MSTAASPAVLYAGNRGSASAALVRDRFVSTRPRIRCLLSRRGPHTVRKRTGLGVDDRPVRSPVEYSVAMGGRPGRRALLGRLAALGWFTQNGEVAATQSVAMLLEEPGLRDALLRRLRELTGTDLGAVALFQGEVVHDEVGRPDLEGWDDRGRPLVVVEAKFGARLEAAQLQAYMSHQIARLDDAARGALVVLVPSYRRSEAEAVLSAVGGDGDGDDATATGSTAVLTWDDLLGVWDEAVQNLPADDRDAVMCDLRQLRALCRTMVGLDIVPLGLVATGGGTWQDRESDLKRLVDEASAQFPYSSRLLPLGTERWPGFDYYRRYLPSRRPGAGQCSLGVVGGLPGSPFWLRYHRGTPNFQSFAERIMASRFAAEARGDGGHVWLPLRVSADRSGATIIGELIEQIETIRAVAEGPESP